jgi:uncharacterized membrane protein YgaE (UPF0421/DUF939 family)
LAIVLLVPRTGPAWQFAFHRFAEVTIGIGVALILAVVWQRSNWQMRLEEKEEHANSHSFAFQLLTHCSRGNASRRDRRHEKVSLEHRMSRNETGPREVLN